MSKHFGGVRAVDGVDLKVERGEILGLIGPNGSGKSTIVNLISGLFPLTAGKVVFNGVDISQRPPHERVTLGIARTFQNIRLFGQLTVWRNLWVAQNSAQQRQENPFRRWLGGGRASDEIEQTLEFFDLAHRRDELAANLSFGEQRRLEFARAFSAKPALLLLDEPAAGMNAEEIEQLDARIRKVRKSGVSVLLIEHHMELVMAVADRIAVLNFG
ncbi:MAG: ABC transporter ATP-binding protein, partial [Burkholderiaceae bacterium]